MRHALGTIAAADPFAWRWVSADPVSRPTAVLRHVDHTVAIALSTLWQTTCKPVGRLTRTAGGG